MRSEREIREAVAALEAQTQNRRRTQTVMAAMYATNEALRWVLGEGPHLYEDLIKDAAWKWSRRSDGAWVSSTGYVVEKYGDGSWVSNRSDTEPIPGWSTSSTLALAKKTCVNDWGARF